MKRIIGYYYDGSEEESDIIFENEKFYVYNEEIEKEKLRWGLTNPWDDTSISFEKKDDIYKCHYESIVYDFIWLGISGFGKSKVEALLNMMSNLKLIFDGYDKNHVEKFMENCE